MRQLFLRDFVNQLVASDRSDELCQEPFDLNRSYLIGF